MTKSVFLLIRSLYSGEEKGEKIFGIISDLGEANKWVEKQILNLSGENGILSPDIIILTNGYKYGDIAYTYVEFELDQILEQPLNITSA